MRKTFVFTILFLVATNYTKTYAQGCSDAGVCTINSIKDQSINFLGEHIPKNSFKSGITYGVGDFDINYTNVYTEYSNLIADIFTISAKLGYTFINGELANLGGLSDLILTANYEFLESNLSRSSALIGLKIPLNNSNLTNEDIMLPMHYQTSLGTYDLLIGFNYSFKNIGISLALQQPIINVNENEFVKPTSSDVLEYKYETTYKYERKGDLMNRVSYNISLFSNKFIIRPSVLSIYHLADDLYTDDSNKEQNIVGSQGLTLNGNVFFVYNFSLKRQLELSIGSPFITRDSRPDGLTRKFVVGLEYAYRF